MKNKKIAVYPGSFDPITLGHIDVINRASKIFDEIIVAVGINSAKKSLFTIAEKIDVITAELSHVENIFVKSFEGLIVDFAKDQNATAMIRGVRTEADYEFEMQLAMANSALSNGIETIFLPTNPKYMFVSSSITKEISRFGGDLSHFVPQKVAELMKSKWSK